MKQSIIKNTQGICIYAAKLSLSMTLLFSCFSSDAVADLQPAPSTNAATIVIEVSGEVPGYTQFQLASYLTSRMQEEISTSWHFVASGSVATAPNRLT